MEKSDFRLYEKDEDAAKDVKAYRDDWDFYDILAYAAKHKTGLKLRVEQDENGELNIVSENFAEWSYHMAHDEKMSGHEVSTYKRQLAQEFKVLLEENDRKAGAIQTFFPYALAKASQDKS